MSLFNDILNAPLPSKSGTSFTESSDNDFEKDLDAAMKEDGDENIFGSLDDDDDLGGDENSDLAGLLGTEPDGDDDDVNPDDIDDLLGDLGEECGEGCATEACSGCAKEDGEELTGGGDLGTDVGTDPLDPGSVPAEQPTSPVMDVDDPTPAAPLDGQEDQDADDMMAAVGTPVLLEECMTVQEAADFMESGDAEIAISEGLMLESTLDELVADLTNGEQAYTESVFAPASRPYKMTKKARLNQLYELSLQIEARAHHDPFVKKIDKAYAIERRIKAGWRKRYGRLAMRRAIKYLRRLMRSNSNGLKKAAKQILPTKK
jgi:hypothetical protein